MGSSRAVVTLAGGVGGAKMAQGLQRALGLGELTVIVNTADDFELHGLRISPDLDTVLYTLAGLANPATGWGISGDTLINQNAMTRLGEEPWFLLGDQDLATHILRTARMQVGATLSQVIADFARSLDVPAAILPVTDHDIRTFVETPSGTFAFQDYFVRRHQTDDVLGIRIAGIEQAKPTDAVLDAIAAAEVIVLAPSNPIVSIGPILDIPGIREALGRSKAVKIGVSPIIGGQALKGPADKMLKTLGHESSALGVAKIYAGLLDGFVIDQVDAELLPQIEALGLPAIALQSIMGDAEDRQRFALEVLDFADSIAVKRVAP
ncbi:2-phospho-L-lactate transferase [soil metagenome]